METAYSQQESDEPRSCTPAPASRFRFTIKGIRLALHIVSGLALAAIYPRLGAQTQRVILGKWSQKVLELLNVHLETSGMGPTALDNCGVMVANHISWLDVFAVNAVAPSSFVAKSEVRQWPIIGTLCKRARTIFISRASRADTRRTNQLIGERIAAGEWVALFPEGTSTDGADVAPFHASLFQPAVDAASPLLPVAIRYHDEQGNARRDAAYIGDMSFFESLVNVLSCDRLHVSLVFLPAISTTGKQRRQLAAEAHRLIRNAVVQSGNHACDMPFVTNL